MSLKQIVEDYDSRGGRAFALTVQALIVVSLVSFSIETLPNLSEATRFWLYVVEVVTVGLFTIEYGLRLLVADRPLRYMTSFYGVVDLAAIVPFYLSTGIDLRSIRLLRMLRLVRILKFARYSRALDRLLHAFYENREELVIYLAATAGLLFLSSVGIYYFENTAQPEAFASVFHAMWWAIVTLTTVGYGDAAPVTAGGRVFTGLILVLGIGIIAVPTGLMAASLSKSAPEA